MKDDHIRVIANRIAEEHRKYGDRFDPEVWAGIAARKVLAELHNMGFTRTLGTTTLHHPSVPEDALRQWIKEGHPEFAVTKCCNAGHRVPVWGWSIFKPGERHCDKCGALVVYE